MLRVLVTGASGIIGTIVREELAGEFQLTPLSRVHRPQYLTINVARDYPALLRALASHDALLHLAYVEETPETVENVLMARNVCRAAFETDPHPRLVLASSIHAVGGYWDWDRPPWCHIARRQYDRLPDPPPRIPDDAPPRPNSLYGALKCYIEALGRLCADRGVPTVVLRFGGVRTDDRLPPEPGYHSFFLSRRDCAEAVRCALTAPLPDGFACAFAVSDNPHRIHSLQAARNLLGFQPRDAAE
jgi:uronate dehydrogenase